MKQLTHSKFGIMNILSIHEDPINSKMDIIECNNGKKYYSYAFSDYSRPLFFNGVYRIEYQIFRNDFERGHGEWLNLSIGQKRLNDSTTDDVMDYLSDLHRNEDPILDIRSIIITDIVLFHQ